MDILQNRLVVARHSATTRSLVFTSLMELLSLRSWQNVSLRPLEVLNEATGLFKLRVLRLKGQRRSFDYVFEEAVNPVCAAVENGEFVEVPITFTTMSFRLVIQLPPGKLYGGEVRTLNGGLGQGPNSFGSRM